MSETTRNRIVAWIERTVRRDYLDDVALVVLYGSHVNGTAHRLSDVDAFFVPKTPAGYALSRTFIVAGVGYDLFPISWERLEGIADLREGLAPLVGEGVVLYAADPADRVRFEMFRDRLKGHCADPVYMRERAATDLRRAATLLAEAAATEDLGTVRRLAGFALQLLAEAVVYAQGTYFRKGLKRLFADLAALPKTPSGFLPAFERAIRAQAAADLRAAATTAIGLAADLIGMPVPPVEVVSIPDRPCREPDWHELADIYQEMLSTVNKVVVDAENGLWRQAFVDGVNLARVFADIWTDFGLSFDTFLAAYDADDLPGYAARAIASAQALRAAIEKHGVAIAEYPSIEDFERNHP